MRRLALLVALAAFALAPQASASETHVVGPGQTLGRIADRYNVSVAALCEANGIQRRDPIRPGQKLVIPSKLEKSAADAAHEAKPDDASDAPPAPAEPAPSATHGKEEARDKDVPEDTPLGGGMHRVD